MVILYVKTAAYRMKQTGIANIAVIGSGIVNTDIPKYVWIVFS